MATYTRQDAADRLKQSGVLGNIDSHGYYDDDYLAEIEKYKDKSWYQHLLENPWLAGNQQQFSPSWLQQIGQMFGDYSAVDSYNAELTSQRSQWLTDRLRQYEQQGYDSPSAQVAREREAGLNPDLTGNISSGSSAENDQPSGNVSMSGRGSDIGEVFNIGTSLLGTVFSVVSNFQSIKSAGLDNNLKAISLGKNYSDWSKGLINDSITEYFNGLDDFNSIESVFTNGSFIDGVTYKMSQKLRNMPISHKERKRVQGIIDDLIYSKDSNSKSYTAWFEKSVNDMVSSLRESRNNRAQVSAKPGAMIGDSRALDFLSTEVYKPIIDAQNDLLLIQTKYNKEYFSTPGLGSAKGSSDKAIYQMNKEMLDVKKRLTDAFKKINEKITGSKDLSPTWKIALQAGLASAEAFSISKLGFQK